MCAALVAGWLAPAIAAAQGDPAPDRVHLRDGTRLRGVVVEHRPGERTVIRLPSGETLGLSAAEIDEVIRLEVPALAPPRPRVRILSDAGDLTLYLLRDGAAPVPQRTGTSAAILRGLSGQPEGVARYFERVCTAPCEARLPADASVLAIASGVRSPFVIEKPRGFAEASTLTLRYEDRSGLRTDGVITALAGVLGGAALGLAAYAIDPEGEVGEALFISSVVAGLAVAIVGFSLMLFPDEARIEVEP